MSELVTLANCDIRQLEDVRRLGLHPSRERAAMIFADGALNNKRLAASLGSQELSTFYDGQIAAGHIDSNPYFFDSGIEQYEEHEAKPAPTGMVSMRRIVKDLRELYSRPRFLSKRRKAA